MNDVMTYILTLVPSITSITGLIVTILVGISKIKKAGNNATAEIKEIGKANAELKKQMAVVLAENRALKAENSILKQEQSRLNARLSHMYFVENEEE